MSRVPASLLDVQGQNAARRIAINKVGIKDIRHPIRVPGPGGRMQHGVGVFSMYVNLAPAHRGTHMSRFIQLLNAGEHVVSVAAMHQLLENISTTLNASQAYAEVRFPYFVNKQAPMSGVSSLLDYNVTLSGERRNGENRITVKVVVPVTSLCPCSKEISAYGAHNQRSHVTVSASGREPLGVEALIRLVEEEASSEIYGLIKRPDEKFITERAYDNPKFVEDMVRDVAARLDAEARILRYTVAVENFESIHNHSAYALIERDKTAP
ncbi:MAG TPA: GTP cyclohydrolase I FolE2 [Gammaproteobacteria bacterium]|nr:GTP cyclohydrolase I FolE2 [Gammaproteobacteria bacterium]